MLIILNGTGAPETSVAVPFTKRNDEITDHLKWWEQKPVFLSRVATGKDLTGLLLKINGDVPPPSKVAGLSNITSETIRLIDNEFKLAIKSYRFAFLSATKKDMVQFRDIEAGNKSIIKEAVLLGVATYVVKAYQVTSSDKLNTLLVPFYAIFGLICAVAGKNFSEQAKSLKASVHREMFLNEACIKENQRIEKAKGQIDLRLQTINQSMQDLGEGLKDLNLEQEKTDLLTLKKMFN